MTDPRFAAVEAAAGAVSRETFERLIAFEAIFRRWSERINLIAPSTTADFWHRHVVDSAQLLKIAPSADIWLDLGSGGGFPGAIVAILLHERDGTSVQLVEANHKKSAFLRTALAELGVRAEIVTARIEGAAGIRQPEIVTARALAPLDVLLRLSAPWLGAGARGLFHKGRDYRGEIETAGDAWQFDLVRHDSIVERESVILEISSLRRKSAV